MAAICCWQAVTIAVSIGTQRPPLQLCFACLAWPWISTPDGDAAGPLGSTMLGIGLARTQNETDRLSRRAHGDCAAHLTRHYRETTDCAGQGRAPVVVRPKPQALLVVFKRGMQGFLSDLLM